MATLLSAMLDLARVDAPDGDDTTVYRTTVDPTFTIGPKVHGGTLQMISGRAAYQAFVDGGGDAEVHPLAITSDYLYAPDPADVELVTRIRKRGRTVSVVDVEVRQNDRIVVTNSVVLGRLDHGEPRYSTPTLPLRDLPVEPPSTGVVVGQSPMADIVHVANAIEFVIDPSTFGPAGGDTSRPVISGWVRPLDGDPDLDFLTLVCDVSPPVVFNLGLFGWAPTVQLSTYLRRRPAPGWVRFQSSSTEVGQGMFEEDHLVIDSTGVVVAQSRQLALIPNG
ncbi:thioesterase family protein [Gordonia sp. TBRC 11910]|uniref:Thioesterase family protein n=1 Tax=Gordonia asplenii TaxID=2725283 RepID=A0A848KZ70_9ACTN|nr:thioesterase family protein [Gordonia asplenii]NMO03886.1 thioesterase family protein [Gordonia asplenii]